MAKGRRRKKRFINQWWWALVALLILWGGYQVWRVHQQIDQQLRHQQQLRRRSATTSTPAVHAPPASNVGITDQGLPRSGTQTYPNRSPLTKPQTRQMQQLLHQGIALATAHRLIAARNKFERAWQITTGHKTSAVSIIRKWLTRINSHTLLDGVAYPRDHWIRLIQVPPRFNLERIAHLYRITPGMLLNINPMIKPRDLRAGSWLLVILGPFDADIHISSRRIDLLVHHQFVLDYPFSVAGVITPLPGVYAVGRVSHAALSKGVPEFITLTLVGDINGRRKTVRISNVASSDIDMVMSTKALAELVKMLSPTFSVVTIRP